MVVISLVDRNVWKWFVGILLLWIVPFIVLHIIPLGLPDGDVYLYHRYAVQLLQGQIPYVDYYLEYPPGSIFVFIIPALISLSQQGYVFLFQVMSLLFLLGTNVMTIFLLEYSDTINISKFKLFLITSIATVITFPVALNRFDSITAFVMIAGLFLFVIGDRKQSIWTRVAGTVLVVFSALIKLYPVFLLPFIGLYEAKRFNLRFIGIQVLCNTLFLIPFGVWILFGWSGFSHFLTYHSDRGLEIESTWSTAIMMVDQVFNLGSYEVVYEYGSFGIRSGVADFLASISMIIFVGIMSLAYLIYFFNTSRNDTLIMMLRAFIISTAGFAVIGKVFSAQYIMWFVPLLLIYLAIELRSIWPARSLSIATSLTMFVALSTTIIFPLAWTQYIEGNPALTGILLIRNILLLLVVLMAIVRMLPVFKNFPKHE